jgi:hypothetical protein
MNMMRGLCAYRDRCDRIGAVPGDWVTNIEGRLRPRVNGVV